MFLVILFKIVALIPGASTAYRTNIDHSVALFNVNASLHRDVEIINISLGESTKLVIAFLAQKFHK